MAGSSGNKTISASNLKLKLNLTEAELGNNEGNEEIQEDKGEDETEESKFPASCSILENELSM